MEAKKLNYETDRFHQPEVSVNLFSKMAKLGYKKWHFFFEKMVNWVGRGWKSASLSNWLYIEMVQYSRAKPIVVKIEVFVQNSYFLRPNRFTSFSREISFKCKIFRVLQPRFRVHFVLEKMLVHFCWSLILNLTFIPKM